MLVRNDNDAVQKTANDLPKTTRDTMAPECTGTPTLQKGEGPFYKSGSPERSKIAESSTPGKKLVVEGYVFNRGCLPVDLVWIDFWQANGDGQYDNNGYNLRGHQYTDESGRYRLETVRPAAYGPRTAHIHVKVQASKNSPVLTTQLFFPGEEKNEKDSIYDSRLEMNVIDTEDGEKATFNFVLDTN